MSNSSPIGDAPTLPTPQLSFGSPVLPSLPPQAAPPPMGVRPTFEYQGIPPLAPGQLPRGLIEVSPWGRVGAYLLDSVLRFVTLGIGWLIWAALLGGGGQTPAKRMLGHTVIAADTHRPVGLGRMFWVRGVLCGFLAPIAVICTLGIVLFMPFWNKHNQNIWDRISNCYVVRRP